MGPSFDKKRQYAPQARSKQIYNYTSLSEQEQKDLEWAEAQEVDRLVEHERKMNEYRAVKKRKDKEYDNYIEKLRLNPIALRSASSGVGSLLGESQGPAFYYPKRPQVPCKSLAFNLCAANQLFRNYTP